MNRKDVLLLLAASTMLAIAGWSIKEEFAHRKNFDGWDIL